MLRLGGIPWSILNYEYLEEEPVPDSFRWQILFSQQNTGKVDLQVEPIISGNIKCFLKKWDELSVAAQFFCSRIIRKTFWSVFGLDLVNSPLGSWETYETLAGYWLILFNSFGKGPDYRDIPSNNGSNPQRIFVQNYQVSIFTFFDRPDFVFPRKKSANPRSDDSIRASLSLPGWRVPIIL